MRYLSLVIFFSLISLPGIVQAAVTINEIAWMGDSVSANHEWIELYNDSESAVVVDGWTLNDGMNLSINLTGTIGPLSYVVLERSSEESAPGTAFLLYTGALVNTGATLRLLDDKGTLQDQVAGGENWQGIGGDNLTKETAQYSTSGWHTAIPTPGSVNQTETVSTVTGGGTNIVNSGSSKTTTNNNKTSTTKSAGKNDEITLTMSGNTLAYVNEAVDFSATLQLGTKDIKTIKYVWNFGDTNFANGSKVTHRYRYPGTYVVTLKTKYDKEEQSARQKITVLPVMLSLVRNTQGDIQIQNNAQYEMDISGYKLIGTKTLTMPDETIILPKGTITVPRTKLEEASSYSFVVLYDATMQAVAYFKPVTVGVLAEGVVGGFGGKTPTTKPNTITKATSFTTVLQKTDKKILPDKETPPAEQIDNQSDLPQSTKEPIGNESKRWPYLALMAILLISLLVIWLMPKQTKQPSFFD